MTKRVAARKRERAPAVPRSLAPLARAMRKFISPSDQRFDAENFETLELDRPGAPGQNRVSWLEQGLSPVRDQGTHNTCTSFAIAGAAEFQQRRHHNQDVQLAPGFIHRCLGGLSDVQGYAPLEALESCAQFGIALGSLGDYPYPLTKCNVPTRMPIAGHGWVPGPNHALDRVAIHGPVIADLAIERVSFLALRKDAIYQTPQSASLILHSVIVVAYDFLQGWALIQNSLGTDWCDGGFGLIRLGTGGGFLTQRGCYFLTV